MLLMVTILAIGGTAFAADLTTLSATSTSGSTIFGFNPSAYTNTAGAFAYWNPSDALCTYVQPQANPTLPGFLTGSLATCSGTGVTGGMPAQMVFSTGGGYLAGADDMVGYFHNQNLFGMCSDTAAATSTGAINGNGVDVCATFVPAPNAEVAAETIAVPLNGYATYNTGEPTQTAPAGGQAGANYEASIVSNVSDVGTSLGFSQKMLMSVTGGVEQKYVDQRLAYSVDSGNNVITQELQFCEGNVTGCGNATDVAANYAAIGAPPQPNTNTWAYYTPAGKASATIDACAGGGAGNPNCVVDSGILTQSVGSADDGGNGSFGLAFANYVTYTGATTPVAAPSYTGPAVAYTPATLPGQTGGGTLP